MKKTLLSLILLLQAATLVHAQGKQSSPPPAPAAPPTAPGLPERPDPPDPPDPRDPLPDPRGPLPAAGRPLPVPDARAPRGPPCAGFFGFTACPRFRSSWSS